LVNLLPIKSGEIFKQSLMDQSRKILNDLGEYDEVHLGDVDLLTDEGRTYVDVLIRLRKKSGN
jgi:hypothetical protein